MRFFFLGLIFASSSFPPALALAEGYSDWVSIDGGSIIAAAANGKKQHAGFFGTVSFGYLANTGNTDSASLNAQTSIGYVSAPWRHAVMLRALKGSTDDATTVEEYEAAEQTDYLFGDNHYVFGALNYSTNRFSGYSRRLSEVIGYGRRVVDTDRHALDLQIGAGARQTRRVDGTDRDEAVVQIVGGYLWNFSENARFSQQIKVEDGSSNTFSESVTAVTANLTGDLGLSISYTAKHNSDVAVGSEKTDTATAVSVIYSF